MKEGWICPRCGKANAPFIGWCDCTPNDKLVSNAEDECPCGYNHHWKLMICYDNVVGDGVTYICDKCGARKKVYDSEIT